MKLFFLFGLVYIYMKTAFSIIIQKIQYHIEAQDLALNLFHVIMMIFMVSNIAKVADVQHYLILSTII